MGLFGKKKTEPRVAGISGDGTYGIEVVGESNYRDALVSIIQRAPVTERNSGEVRTTAFLVKEPGNTFDSNAIAVFIDGSQVGYIGRNGTGDIHDVIAAAAEQGYSSDGVGCEAIVGWDANNPNPFIGVRLDLAWKSD